MALKNQSALNFALSDSAGVELCRVLGLAISNISMYGMDHSVTATSVASAYDELVAKVDSYGEIEFVLEDNGLIINGRVVETERTTGQLLVAQLSRLGVHDFTFSSPLNRQEFNKFVSIVSAPPGSEILSGGFESAISKAKLKCIQVKNVAYARVEKDADLSKMNFNDNGSGSRSYDLDTTSGGGAKVFDLDMDLDMGLSELGFEEVVPVTAPDNSMLADARSYLEKKKSADDLQQRLIMQVKAAGTSPEERRVLKNKLLGAGFAEDDWSDLLVKSNVEIHDSGYNVKAVEALHRIRQEVETLAAHGDAIVAGKSSAAMSSILDSIGQEVARIASEAKGHITTLAGKVDADRETIARVERDARASGIGLNLSRDELLESLAEINQELAQSLTVVSSVTDILVGEKMGAVTDAQRDILNVAAQGVEKIQKLVSYLNNLSGFPEQLSPDRNLLDEAYGN